MKNNKIGEAIFWGACIVGFAINPFNTFVGVLIVVFLFNFKRD